MTRTHEIKLDGYGAHTTLADDRPVMLLGTAESYGIEMLHIVPGKDWAELTITATFNASDGSSTDVLMDTDGNITVPTEATAKSGSGRVVFTGVSNGIQRISCDLDYFVVAHSAINGAQSGGVAPSWFEQAANRFMPLGGTTGQVLTKKTDADFDAEWQDSKGGEGGGGTTDHSKLENRDAADQHPISAITGLEEALTRLTGTTETLTPTQVYDAIKSGKSVVLKHTDFLFSFASFNIVEGDKVVVSTSIVKYGGGYFVFSLAGFAGSNEWVFNMTEMAEADDIPVAVNEALAQAKASGDFDGADGKTAYAYAVEGGYTGTETEFAAKLAKEKFANPYALTFTGAVNEVYDGSSAKTIEIPSGGSGGSDAWNLIEHITAEDAAISYEIPLQPGAKEYGICWEYTLPDGVTAPKRDIQVNASLAEYGVMYRNPYNDRAFIRIFRAPNSIAVLGINTRGLGSRATTGGTYIGSGTDFPAMTLKTNIACTTSEIWVYWR